MVLKRLQRKLIGFGKEIVINITKERYKMNKEKLYKEVDSLVKELGKRFENESEEEIRKILILSLKSDKVKDSISQDMLFKLRERDRSNRR